MTDWQNIRTEYEAGASQRSLAVKYGISRQAIIKHVQKEHWITKLVTVPQDIVTSPVTDEEEDSDPAIINQVRKLIAQRLKEKPDNKDIKMLMDSFSQVKKIELLIPAGEDFSAFDMREFLAGCTDEELEIVRPIIAAVQARRTEKITPIKKVG